MSRRARSRAAAIAAKHVALVPLDDDRDHYTDDDMPDDVCLHCRDDGMDPDCDWLLPCPDCGGSW